MPLSVMKVSGLPINQVKIIIFKGSARGVGPSVGGSQWTGRGELFAARSVSFVPPGLKIPKTFWRLDLEKGEFQSLDCPHSFDQLRSPIFFALDDPLYQYYGDFFRCYSRKRTP